jgi:hypothetical protein
MSEGMHWKSVVIPAIESLIMVEYLSLVLADSDRDFKVLAPKAATKAHR